MSTYNFHNCDCEFEFPINLKIPVTITPTVKIQSVEPAKEILNVDLQPNIQLNPLIEANEPHCASINGCHNHKLSAIQA
jgi:hypothetical protein